MKSNLEQIKQKMYNIQGEQFAMLNLLDELVSAETNKIRTEMQSTIDKLEFKVLELEKILGTGDLERWPFNFSNQLAITFSLLMRRKRISYYTIGEVIYAGKIRKPDYPSRVVSVNIYKMRQVLKEHNITIHGDRKFVWLDEPTKSRVLAMVEKS